jgi:hypothetical protein
MTVKTAPDLDSLIERYQRHRAHYRSGGINETELRVEFIDPLFIALGWDVRNEAGYAEAYKDVVHEDAIKVGTATKAPDYAFRVGGVRKFFLETKKPSVDISRDPDPAWQLRRYAWSAKLPLSILTNFEHVAVYDTRIKPSQSDPASTARVILIPYTELADRWSELQHTFSLEAIRMGSFDEYAESTRKKRGTAEVDDAFLADLEHWRDLLARNIALRNSIIHVGADDPVGPNPGRSHGLTQRELNYAVQITIDRIIFLRICEDRGIEAYGRLQALTNGTGIYARLQDLFRQADERYNSGLFHFHEEAERSGEPDRLTTTLWIDDRVLKDIFKNLYYPYSPYEFSALPADILGQIYERFLGSVIRLTPGHRAVVEEKPEVRKAGGVYYTPTYIVDYIVEQTVGKLVEDKTPKQVEKLKFLDPACGSGSFLIGAYQYLLDWHRDYYIGDGVEKHTKVIYQGAGEEWRLTMEERRRILLNNIYGVDIDQQAVEVSKLSLLLKALEGETSESLGGQLRFAYKQRALPDLRDNIKCGNSLIGPDFYQTQQLGLAGFDEEERYRINVFDWEAEFPGIMRGKNVGFDSVIGNPPYIRIQHMKEFAPNTLDYYKANYRAASKGNYDIYAVFVEQGLRLLNRGGLLGYILPHKFFNAKYGEPLRGLVAEGKHLHKIVHFGHQQVFANASTYTCLLFLENAGGKDFEFIKVEDLVSWRLTGEGADSAVLDQSSIDSHVWNFVVGEGTQLYHRLTSMPVKLGDIATRIFQGVVTSADPVFFLDLDSESATNHHLVRVRSKETGKTYELERDVVHPLLKKSKDLRRYRAKSSKWVLIPYEIHEAEASGRTVLIPQQTFKVKFPRAWDYLCENYERLRSRENGKMRHDGWYGYVYPKNIPVFPKPKLVVQVLSKHARFALDDQGLFFTGGGNAGYYGIQWSTDESPYSLLYVLGLLNSQVSDFVLHRISTPFRGGYW